MLNFVKPRKNNREEQLLEEERVNSMNARNKIIRDAENERKNIMAVEQHIKGTGNV